MARDTESAPAAVDLRGSSLPTLRSIDLRSSSCDFWADERSMWDHFVANWAGLDDAAWRLPGAAPSDAGGSDRALFDDVAHVADWYEEGAAAIEEHAATGCWRDGPAEGFDAWNRRRLEASRDLGPVAVVARFDAMSDRIRSATRSMPASTLRSSDGWSWTHECLHSHIRSHLAVVGPWCARVDWPAPEEV